MSGKKWTKEVLIQAIKAASIDGTCSSARIDRTVVSLCRREFGGFVHACKIAGVSAVSTRPRVGQRTPEKCSVDGCCRLRRSIVGPYCETHYYRLRRTGNLLRSDGLEERMLRSSCLYCGEATINGRMYCSSRCSTRAHRCVPVDRPCIVCGRKFRPIGKNIACSDRCTSIRKNHIYQAWRGSDRYMERLLASAYGEASRLAISQKDDWLGSEMVQAKRQHINVVRLIKEIRNGKR